MTEPASTIPTAKFAEPYADENPYASPTTSDVKASEPVQHLSNYQVHQLAHMLRAHGILTTLTSILFAIAFLLLYGPPPMDSVAVLIFTVTILLAVVLCLLTVMLAFTAFPFIVAILAFASLLVPASWPFTFLVMHLWGRRTLKFHAIEIGLFGKPKYIARVAEQI